MVEIKDEEGCLIAKAKKVIYVQKKKNSKI